MEVLESIDHEGVECKCDRADSQGYGARQWREFRAEQLSLPGQQPSQHKAAKVDFDKERNEADEPGHHDEKGKLGMRRGREEMNVIAQRGRDQENHDAIQATEQQPC